MREWIKMSNIDIDFSKVKDIKIAGVTVVVDFTLAYTDEEQMKEYIKKQMHKIFVKDDDWRIEDVRERDVTFLGDKIE